MRNHLIKEVENLAKEDKRICVVTGDLGYSVLENFAKEFPDRYFNAGVSEQNMASIAAGMALEGNVVYIYSIANFPTLRCVEQIRNDICYHNANVKIVAVGGGFAYGQLGMSHHATEDLAIMRALPNMRVYSPADPMEAVETVRKAHSVDGPCYIRLAKGSEPNLHPAVSVYDIEKAIEIYPKGNIAILATGSILIEAKSAAEILHGEGINVRLYSFPSLKPLDEDIIKELAQKCELIITIEEHTVIGGFGGAVAEVIACMEGKRAKLIRIGLKDIYTSIVGSQGYLRDFYDMSTSKIVKIIKENHVKG